MIFPLRNNYHSCAWGTCDQGGAKHCPYKQKFTEVFRTKVKENRGQK